MFLFSIPVTISRDVLTDFIIPIIGFAITIGITVWNVRSVNNNTKEQIENQNKQTYRPRLKLAKIEKIPSEDIESDYELMSISKKAYLIKNNKKYNYSDWLTKTCTVKLNIFLKNIGHGIANDIKLYSIIDGGQVYGAQSINEDLDQEMKSTEEIEINTESKFKVNLQISKEPITGDNDDDFVLYLCNYEDLNNNNYQVLIGIIIKKIIIDEDLNIIINTSHYYHQQETKEYNDMIEKHKENYNTIMKKINKKRDSSI